MGLMRRYVNFKYYAEAEMMVYVHLYKDDIFTVCMTKNHKYLGRNTKN